MTLDRKRTIMCMTTLTLAIQLAACGGQPQDPGVESVTEHQYSDAETYELPSSDILLPSGYRGPLPEFSWSTESQDPTSGSSISNINEIAAATGSLPYRQQGWRGHGQTIAILDNGFSGFSDSILSGRLPASTVYVPGRDGTYSADTAHGTKLAELIHGLAPEASLLLINANGYSNFVRAIDQVVASPATMVVYAQVWEYGGHFDGRGFINAQVNRAIDRGILWFNAAGNYGLSTWEGFATDWYDNPGGPANQFNTYRSKITPSRDGERIAFHLPAPGQVKIVLSWDDFGESSDYKTREDFDLIIEDAAGREIASSRLIQDGLEHSLDGRFSAHAREFIRTQLPQGTWFARIETRNRPDDRRRPLFRFSVDGFGAQILDQRAQNSVMIPGDNPRVVTVGAIDTATSGRGVRGPQSKPELVAPSKLVFSGGQSVVGSSAATAIAAATVAVWQSARQPLPQARGMTGPDQLDFQEFTRWLHAGSFGLPWHSANNNDDDTPVQRPAVRLRLGPR